MPIDATEAKRRAAQIVIAWDSALDRAFRHRAILEGLIANELMSVAMETMAHTKTMSHVKETIRGAFENPVNR